MKLVDKNFELNLVGEVIVAIDGAVVGSGKITIKTKSGRTFVMHHEQDCCEDVSVQVVHGNVQDLIGKGVSRVEEKIIEGYPSRESATKTIFAIYSASAWSALVIEWLGESNGYYSESVSFQEEIP